VRRLIAVAGVLAVVIAVIVGTGTGLSGSGDARAQAQGLVPAPDRGPDEGQGPFRKLVIRGGTLIDGTGARARGPVDIVVTGRRITQIKDVDEADLGSARPPFDADHEVDATGMHVLPGFVDLHVHAGGPPKNP
jgi:hypothetical protein